MTLLKDLISIPERVHQGDFVLKLSQGVEHPDETLASYVVTPQLVQAFNDALAFIRSAVETRSSKAAYLHGSFGSGKSHFMAVLSLLLNGNVRARSLPELAEAVGRHNAWTEGKRFLVVPFHMIGARDMESAILGGYAEHVRRIAPEAPVPGFYLADGLFRDARRLRDQQGDQAFFSALNARRAGGRWGRLAEGWDAQSFESAMLEAPAGEDRTRLVGDLIETFFESYRAMAAAQGESFLPLDDGLAVLSKHARSLGYDAVVLFLDELILWLASRAADVSFVSSEGTKLVKLVEATHADRPVPLVSFVARQRDLRDLVGDHLAAGSIQTQFADSLKYWEARFHRITLEDRNLPTIAEKRILAPVSDAARVTLNAAFDELMRDRRDILDALLTESADRELFRKVYPFSPALVESLVAISSALQRERTALKLMLQLLVDRREELELGQIIGVGDLWDVIAVGDEPFSDAMRIHFENATRLWEQKLLPLLERQHGITWQALRSRETDPIPARNLRGDARILKTLLLAALVPEVRPLRALTAQRLAALNHGTFRSPIPGREATDVLRKCREWAAEVGEIKITDDPNPVISVQITGVDIEPIIEQARTIDRPGNRKIKIRELIFATLGITDTGELFHSYPFTWRGTRRRADILYENIRELRDDNLRTTGANWSLVIDYPFDDAQYTPHDDHARLMSYAGGSTHTIAWLPLHLSDRALRELGRLVILDFILTGEQRFSEYAGHLSLTDRAQARALATNQRDQLRARIQQYLEAAYGVSDEPREGYQPSIERAEQLVSLDPTFTAQRPVGANLKDALDRLLDQALSHEFPSHPHFETDVKTLAVKKVWVEVERAAEMPDSRVLVSDRATRQIVRSIVNPLRLGEMAETHLHLHEHWKNRLLQSYARDPGATTVGRLRRWIDEPQPMGLPVEVQNLVILTFAAQTNRSFRLHGGAVQPGVESLADDLELIEQALPDETVWTEARRRLAALFGLDVPESRNAAHVSQLEQSLAAKVRELWPSVDALTRRLSTKLVEYGVDAAEAPRLRTAQAARALLRAASGQMGVAAVQALARSPIETSEAAMAGTMARASELDEALRTFPDPIFTALRALDDERKAAAQQILDALREALASDEHAVALRAKLSDLQNRALALLTRPTTRAARPPSPTPTPGARLIREGRRDNLDRADAHTVLQEIERELEGDERKRLSIVWTITER
jgi:hypothetical protein